MQFLEDLEKMSSWKQLSMLGGLLVTIGLTCAVMGCQPWRLATKTLKKALEIEASN